MNFISLGVLLIIVKHMNSVLKRQLYTYSKHIEGRKSEIYSLFMHLKRGDHTLRCLSPRCLWFLRSKSFPHDIQRTELLPIESCTSELYSLTNRNSSYNRRTPAEIKTFSAQVKTATVYAGHLFVVPQTNIQLEKPSSCTTSRYWRRHIGLATGTGRAFDMASFARTASEETHRRNTVNAYPTWITFPEKGFYFYIF
ncbi:unnamed protein product [Phytomonas sp. EM1]|nr:unnamed protein product [Phytomonas sp. EM1]|eukprot:CCW65126.1 unnamed protein product [Phytomonas sp. isolate EM1]